VDKCTPSPLDFFSKLTVDRLANAGNIILQQCIKVSELFAYCKIIYTNVYRLFIGWWYFHTRVIFSFSAHSRDPNRLFKRI